MIGLIPLWNHMTWYHDCRARFYIAIFNGVPHSTIFIVSDIYIIYIYIIYIYIYNIYIYINMYIYIYLIIVTLLSPENHFSHISPQKTHLPTSAMTRRHQGLWKPFGLGCQEPTWPGERFSASEEKPWRKRCGRVQWKKSHIFLWNNCDTTRKHGGFDGDLSGKK
jgi:hypothetical protein